MKFTSQIAFLSFLLIGVFSYNTSNAQDTKDTPAKTEPSKAVMAEEIEVVRPYKPVLANAAKIRRNPDLNDAPTFKPVLNYQILDKKLELNTDIRTLQYQQLNLAPIPASNRNSFKAGLGSLSTSMGELYLNNGRDEALQTGFFAKHLGQKGKINKQEFSQQHLGAFLKTIGKNSSFNAQAGFRRLGTYFYGADPLALNSGDPAQQGLSLLQLSADLSSNFSTEPKSFSYGLKMGINQFGGKTANKERSILISGMANKKWKDFDLGLNGSVDLTKVEDVNSSINNNLLKINPSLNYQAASLRINLGLNFIQESGLANRSSLFPSVNAELSLSPEYATLFAGLTGDVKKTSLTEFSFENPFLGQDINIKNAKESNHIYAGIKGNAGAALGYKASVWFKRVQDLPLLLNMATDLNRFELTYVETVGKLTGFDLEVNLKTNDILDINTRLQAIDYQLENDAKAWFKPGLRIESQAIAKLSEKIRLRTGLIYQGETFGSGVNAEITRLKSFIELNTAADYRFNKNWGAFLQVNNLFNQEYQQYLYYPQLGLNLFGGIHYSF